MASIMATANRNINSEHAVKLMQKIQIMEGDVTLIAGKDSQKFTVHRLIMMTASNFFEMWFKPNLRQAIENEITLNEVDRTTLESIIGFCYTGHIDITETSVVQIATVALRFELVEVEQKCAKFWESILNIENCVCILQIADKHKLLNLRLQAMMFVCENFQNVPIVDLVKIKCEIFEEILSSDRMNASEAVVFEDSV